MSEMKLAVVLCLILLWFGEAQSRPSDRTSTLGPCSILTISSSVGSVSLESVCGQEERFSSTSCREGRCGLLKSIAGLELPIMTNGHSPSVALCMAIQGVPSAVKVADGQKPLFEGLICRKGADWVSEEVLMEEFNALLQKQAKRSTSAIKSPRIHRLRGN